MVMRSKQDQEKYIRKGSCYTAIKYEDEKSSEYELWIKAEVNVLAMTGIN